MQIYLYTEQTAYGEFVRLIVADSSEEAFTIKDQDGESLKDKGWNHVPEDIFPAHNTMSKGIIFDGGGDNG